MIVNDMSIGIHTSKVEECRDFYVKYFNVKVTFDCGWYVTIKFEDNGRPQFLNFMQPQTEGAPLFTGGLSIFLEVATPEMVDAEYERLTKAGLKVSPPEDHDYGDRAIELFDPVGITVYIFAYRPMSEEFKKAVIG